MGLRIVKPDTNINFIGLRKAAFALSALLIIIGIISLVSKGGPRYGIDFSGGIIIQTKFVDQDIDIGNLKDGLEDIGLPGLVVQKFGMDQDNEYLIRTSEDEISPEQVRDEVSSKLAELFRTTSL